MFESRSQLLKIAHDRFANASCLVLSPSCPGHDVIADIVAKNFYASMSPLKGPDCICQLDADSRFVGFTNELLSAHQIKTLLPIFTIRDSVFESILAQAVGNYFVKSDEDWDSFLARVKQPIRLDEAKVLNCMHLHFSWYRHYVTLLDKSNFVVSYDIVSGMIAGNDRVDLEKIAVIENLKEIKHLVSSNIDSGTQMAIDEFYDRRCRIGSGDIYNMLQLQ